MKDVAQQPGRSAVLQAKVTHFIKRSVVRCFGMRVRIPNGCTREGYARMVCTMNYSFRRQRFLSATILFTTFL